MTVDTEAEAWFRREFSNFVQRGYQIHAQSRSWTQSERELRRQQADSLYTEASHRGLTQEAIQRIRREVCAHLGREH